MVHSYNQFHAAGHGTFFSGQLRVSNYKSFLWVYDCGSKRKGRMSTLVSDLHSHAGTSEIDMLCISHFDGDHVNGLLELLQLFTVKRLFLPYLPFDKRLQIACNLDLDVQDSTDAMLFTLDPGGFLSARNLADRVGRIILVVGGKGDGAAAPVDIDEMPNAPNPLGDDARQGAVETLGPDEEYSRIVEDGPAIPAVTISHTTPLTISGKIWEFVFFNKQLPKGVAPVSKKPLAVIQGEVRAVLKKWALSGQLPRQVEQWRKDLRECYVGHFGKSPKGRNDISLCLLSRPLLNANRTQCSLFKTPFGNTGCAHTLVPISGKGKQAILLTGDISLDKKVLTQVKGHFKASRWDDVHVMQIPHHGSRHSWKSGNAAQCGHEYSVLCVPDVDSSGSHPHSSVVDDLADQNPLYADYSNSIVYCFHVK